MDVKKNKVSFEKEMKQVLHNPNDFLELTRKVRELEYEEYELQRRLKDLRSEMKAYNKRLNGIIVQDDADEINNDMGDKPSILKSHIHNI
jgi:hypothetical protein